MQPSTLTSRGPVQAQTFVGYQLDLFIAGPLVLVRNSQHFMAQQVLRQGRLALATSYLFDWKSASPLYYIYGSVQEEPGNSPACIPYPLKSRCPLRRFLWGKFASLQVAGNNSFNSIIQHSAFIIQHSVSL